MADVLTINDLIADKKHSTFFAEVVTGKSGGVPSGPDISTSTNQVTGQVQKTLPQVLADLGMVVQTWTATSGGTLANAAQVFLNNKVGSAGLGNYYAWSGTFPKVITAGLDPAITAGFIQRTDIGLRRELTDEGTSIDDLSKLNTSSGSTKVQYTRGSSHCVPATVARKFLTVRHCSDWGIACDGSDETTKLQNLVLDINAIPNINGNPVHVVFSGQGDSASPILKFSSTVNFTRPVCLDGCGEVEIQYTGTGTSNAFEFGPSTLTGDSVSPTGFIIHKHYSVDNFLVRGGTTSGVCFYFNNYILYPKVNNCIFKYFGGAGSWAVRFQCNNWWAVVNNCGFDAHLLSHTDDGVKRNFVDCPGVSLTGVRDEFATRLLAENTQVFASGYTMGGIAYRVSGWDSRIIGGSIEGMKYDCIVGAGCNDVEISVYSEKNYAEEASSFIQLSYSGDPYFAIYPWVKRLKIHDTYVNMHNTDTNNTPARFLTCANNVKFIDPEIDSTTLVASSKPIFELPDIAGHSGLNVTRIKQDGNIGAQSFLITNAFSSLYKPGFDTKVKNYSKLSDFSDIVSGFSALAAPLSSNFGTTSLSIQSDGTGGKYYCTKIASDNTSDSGYERYRIGQQLNYGLFQCTSAATNQTYITLTFALSANLLDLQGEDVILSFQAKAFTTPVLLKAVHSFLGGAGLITEGANTQTVAIDGWYQYAIKINVPQLAPGTVLSNGSQVVQIVLPAGAVFSVAIAEVMVNIGQIAYPLQAAV